MRRPPLLAVSIVLAALLTLPPLAAAAIPGQLGRPNLRPALLRAPQVSADIKALIRDFSGASGGIATPSISYGDLTGDGLDEVVVPIFSGGTAGDIAYYVLSVVNGRATVVRAVNRTYKVGVSIRGRKLVERVPIYAGDDANCCPSRIQTTVFRWNGRILAVQNRTVDRVG